MGRRTCFLKTNLIKIDMANKIKIQKPIKFSEKISKKNPPKKALKRPDFSFRASKRLIKTTTIKTKFNKCPREKWGKKLA